MIESDCLWESSSVRSSLGTMYSFVANNESSLMEIVISLLIKAMDPFF